MRNIKLVLEYDGTNFCGWQWQPKGRSIQGTLQDAIRRLLQKKTKITASGRTDAGVHALGQVANFYTESSLGVNSIRLGLNSYLPRDVVVLHVEEADAGFHARYDARRRKYRYIISKRPRAIGWQFAWYCKYALDLERIRAAAAHLVGQHTFSAFCKPRKNESHYLCKVEKIEWRETPDEILMGIEANRFLHHMVRIIVGTMVDVGREKMKPETVKAILESQDHSNAGSVAPAHGLFLENVYY
ncbi:tRNA pseudouridine(38-40) synthase TruA [candidate division KSB1 bacterium]|nr:tRNA pseudouridine(38-40) synthase TruA [candidate division KSB1 bacterium]NIR70153.1 tRNA pseudouridine(38-40) synthase TruA [candidate division KSB1 bacterium]NIS28065.1 tRNA pseudouridine(38-40) synthase TruA [candidate division KSB1 bacterium]NIT74934.1 tRNA pseudouridine(38-40) synthase TruA [candidate division KSB1 bacterium]NIU28718.1 tRNA pseudouridine(38-40) synthase TruA [candidate division KSB1 bacterium]